MRLEQACGRIGQWMLAMFEVGCTYGWRHGSLLKMRVKQVDPHANVIRLEPGTTKNKKGLEVTMPRRVRELLLECIKGKAPEECLFTRANGTPVRDFRRSWRKACAEAGIPDLHFHDLRRTAARNMRRGHISERVAMEIGGWKTTLYFIGTRLWTIRTWLAPWTCWKEARTNNAKSWNERSPPSVASR